MRLAIVIPAYNEEDGIALIVQRCLDAKQAIVSATPIEEVEIIVVSDGSVDRTEERARAFESQIRVIAYPKNRGYGAAIKCGFDASEADLVSFLDADGTCDPLNFVPMIQKLLSENAEICLGSRMGSDSKMPAVRRLGNRIYRFIVNTLGHSDVQDVASGMRVIRRSALPRMYPLPDGLHFTPAMSCRAVMDPNLKIVEIDMTYAERIGHSKLSVIHDGFRFLGTIIQVALSFRPFKFIAPLGLFLVLVATIYSVPLVLLYLQTGRVEEGMIYRILAIVSFSVAGVMLIGVGILMDRVSQVVHAGTRKRSRITESVDRLFSPANCLRFSLPFLIGAMASLFSSVVQYMLFGKVLEHWSQIALGMFCTLLGFVFITLYLMGVAIGVLESHQEYRK